MKLLASVCGFVAVLTIVCMADEPEKMQYTIVGVTLVLVDTNTKGISEGKEEIKKIEIPAGIK